MMISIGLLERSSMIAGIVSRLASTIKACRVTWVDGAFLKDEGARARGCLILDFGVRDKDEKRSSRGRGFELIIPLKTSRRRFRGLLSSSGPMPRTMPEPGYFSIPSAVVGGVVLRKYALNWIPCVRPVTHTPTAWMNSPAYIDAM